MNKLLLLLLVIGLIYVFNSCNILENMSNLNEKKQPAKLNTEHIIVSASPIKYNDPTNALQYIEFVNNKDKKDIYVMIDYKELSKPKIRSLIKTIKDQKIVALEKHMCSDKDNSIEHCINNISKNIPVFLINIKDKEFSDNSIIAVNAVSNKKQDGSNYTSLIPHISSNVDFTNKKLLASPNLININDVAALHFTKNKILVINTESIKEIKETDLINLNLNEIIIKDKNNTKIYYLSN
jgi:hypothetical protein